MTQQTPPPPHQEPPGGHPSGGHTGSWSHGGHDSAHDISLDRLLHALRTRDLPRRSDEKWIGGVCAGIARRLRVDPLIVRAGFIALGLVLGAGVTLYLIAWLLLPDERDSIMLEGAARHRDGGAIALMVVTIVVATSGFGWLWGWGGGWGPGPLVPLVVIGICVWVYMSSRDNRPGDASPRPYSTGGANPTTGATPATGTVPPTSTMSPASTASYSSSAPAPQAPYAAAPAPAYSVPPTYSAPPTYYPTGSAGHLPGAAPGRPGGATPPPAPTSRVVPAPPRPRRRPLGAALSWALLGLAAAVGGVTALVLQQTSYDDVAGRVGVGAALGVLGAGLIVAGLAGRKAGGVSLVGWLLALVTAVLVILPKDLTLNGEYGDATWTPTAATTQKFELSSGDGRLDLTKVAAPASPVVIPAKVSFGHLTVVVPAGVPVEVRTHVGLGALDVEDGIEREIGWQSDTGGKDVDRTIRLGTQPATLVVDANVGIGAISIERKAVR